MAHEIEVNEAGESFAFNRNYGSAWHQLGTEMHGEATVEEMLSAARADFVVHKDPMYVQDPAHDEDGLIESGRYITWRRRDVYNEDGDYEGPETQILGYVGPDYTVLQNEEVLRFALSLVNDALPEAGVDGAGQIDCVGVLNDGERFFATIPLPDLVLDPNGINDVHKRNLAVVTGHNGKTACSLVNTTTRVVCSNTVSAALAQRHQQVAIRHVTGRMTDTPLVITKARLGLLLSADEEFEKMMLEMMGHKCSWATVEKVIDRMWPMPDDANERTQTNHEKRKEQIHDIWTSDRASGGVGNNNYAGFQAVTEWMEFQQHIVGEYTDANRAERALTGRGFAQRVNRLAKAFTTGQPVRALSKA